MIFSFLKYLQPTNYFSLKKNDTYYIFPLIEDMDKEIINMFTDKSFKSEFAREYDISWQAIQSGYIGEAKNYKEFKEIPIVDQYRFLRKNFNEFWVVYVWLIRIFTFKNPIKETIALFKTKSTNRISYKEQILKYNYLNFKSKLLEQEPLISVIIPTLNRYKYLKDVLRDLEKQTYKNFEVIIVDQTEKFQRNFYSGWNLNLKFWYQKEKALWRARNEAIISSKGKLILLYDDDSLIENDWIEHHIKCIDFFNADISSGVSISTVGDKVPENYSFFKISEQLDTGNALIKKKVFEEIGLFDRQFEKQRMGDGEFGLRAYLQGFKNVSNPYAKRIHLKVNTGGLRQMGSWDGFRPKKWLDPRPIPSVLYFYRKYFGNKSAKLSLLRNVPLSIIPYKYKGNKILMISVSLLSILLLPLILLQVKKSWSLSSEKLKEGSKISNL